MNDSANSPESQESAAEKRLDNELKLLKQVQAAEKEKALSDLELHRGEMSPEEYSAARQNINDIFADAGTKADAKNRQDKIQAKQNEASNLEIDARNKTAEADQIKVAPENVVKANQKTLDANAASGEKAKAELKERLEMLERIEKDNADPGSVPQYEGVAGVLKKYQERYQFHRDYGYTATTEEARAIENQRLAQAQGDIDRAANYGPGEDEKRKRKTELMNAAGAETGRRDVLLRDIKTDQADNASQNQVDSQVAAMHRASTSRVVGASEQTAAAVQAFTAATVGGFKDVHSTFVEHQRQLDALRRQLQEVARSH